MGWSKEFLENQRKERLKEINVNRQGYSMKVIEYYDSRNMIIEFQDEYKTRVKCTYRGFKNGEIKNPNHKTVESVGYMGLGEYSYTTNPESYKKWCDMIIRCYNPYELNKHPTYIDCYIEDEMLCYQNFAKWYEENHYEIPNEALELDKDILYKGNKIYSKNTMILVPHRINCLFTKSSSKRGEYPIGVNYYKKYNCLVVRCQTLERRVHLGYFSLNEPFKAFTTYKNFKENYIKKVADEYKELIPAELYKAMYEYEVEIND